MELLPDSGVTSMEITAEQTGIADSPDAFAIASMGRLLGQRIHAEVQEYTAVLSKLVLGMQRASGSETSGTAATSGAPRDADATPELQQRCCAAKLLRMHALTAAIGRALDRAAGDQ